MELCAKYNSTIVTQSTFLKAIDYIDNALCIYFCNEQVDWSEFLNILRGFTTKEQEVICVRWALMGENATYMVYFRLKAFNDIYNVAYRIPENIAVDRPTLEQIRRCLVEFKLQEE